MSRRGKNALLRETKLPYWPFWPDPSGRPLEARGGPYCSDTPSHHLGPLPSQPLWPPGALPHHRRGRFNTLRASNDQAAPTLAQRDHEWKMIPTPLSSDDLVSALTPHRTRQTLSNAPQVHGYIPGKSRWLFLFHEGKIYSWKSLLLTEKDVKHTARLRRRVTLGSLPGPHLRWLHKLRKGGAGGGLFKWVIATWLYFLLQSWEKKEGSEPLQDHGGAFQCRQRSRCKIKHLLLPPPRGSHSRETLERRAE